MMKRWWISLFLLVLLHTASVLLYRNLLRQNSLNEQKQAALDALPSYPAFWALGDSHVLLGWNPEGQPGMFNFATTSEYYALNLQRLHHLLQTRKKPLALILPFELHSFSPLGRKLWLGHEMDDVFWASIYNPDLNPDEKSGSDFRRWWIGARFFPYAGQFYQWTQVGKSPVYPLSPNGAVLSDEVYDGNPEAARKRARSHFPAGHQIDPLQVQSFFALLNLCRKEEIPVLLVQFPVHPAYRAEVPAQTIRFLDSLETTLPIRAVYARSILDSCQNCFMDPDHLNRRGANALMRLIQNEVLAGTIRPKIPAATP